MGKNIKKMVEAALGAGQAIEDFKDAKISNIKTGRKQRKLSKKMVEKNLPSHRVIGIGTHKKRQKEVLKLVKKGSAGKAREKLISLTNKFEKDNPEYKHKITKKSVIRKKNK